MFHNFKITNFRKLYFEKKKFYLIDGITGSGKTIFSNILKKKNHKFKIISKDLFLKPRNIRILITKKNKNKKNINQNLLQYDFKKYLKIINKIKKKNEENITLKNLYNRKSGKNDLTINFKFKKDIIYIIEGIYVVKDFNFLPEKHTTKIFIEHDIYSSLVEKLRRIRDKKISIPLVINEYINIHLYSYLNHIKKNKFDFIINEKGTISQFNQTKINLFIKKINLFIKRHRLD